MRSLQIQGRLVSTRTKAEKALLVGVEEKRCHGGWSIQTSLRELAQLARTAGAEVVGTIAQRLERPVSSYLGRGKLEEIIALKDQVGYTVVICDDELFPGQQRILEDTLTVKVLDRTALILDIFARGAKTREGQLQVELAQHEYLLPRLAGQWSHLERLGGGIGTRGPGESQLETDRRLVRDRIARLKRQLEEVRKHRSLYREKRRTSHIPIAALVGYTNAGKSTIFNSLSHAHVMVQNKPFSTLDPVTRRISGPNSTAFLLTDTVGFIQKLPHSIVASFRATLEELEDADLIVHVVDVTHPGAPEQCQTVEDTLALLHIEAKPRIMVLNKVDLLTDCQPDPSEADEVVRFIGQLPPPAQKTSLVSALTGVGLRELVDVIIDSVSSGIQSGAGKSV